MSRSRLPPQRLLALTIFLVYTTKAPAPKSPPVSRPTSSSAHSSTTIASAQVPRLSLGQPGSFNQNDGATESLRTSLPAPHHTTYVQRTIGEALNEHDGSDSPVMNETLNVIDEHITDLSTPRQTLNNNLRIRDDSESEYSSHLDGRSYVAGPETDDEDNAGLDEATVRAWDHVQTSQHLRELGVDSKHCDIFNEQEITGDVLLDMDQNFVYMKEFDFGVMGRRLKTWHKIRDFQRDVKSQQSGSRRASDRGRNGSLGNVRRSSQGASTPSLSQIPSMSQPIAEEPDQVIPPLQMDRTSKRTSWAGAMPSNSWNLVKGPESPNKLERTTSRYSRRHSSIDFGAQPDLELSSLATTSTPKKLSTDRTWSMAGTGSTQATTPTSSIRPSTKLEDQIALPSPTVEQTPLEFDRGYFSGNEVDNRKLRSRLSKAHSRQTSIGEQHSKRSSMIKKHARLSSAGSVREESAFAPSPASTSYYGIPKGRFRSSSARASPGQTFSAGMSPTVTNLETESTASVSSPIVEKMKMQDRARRLLGVRAASEAVTKEEKSDVLSTTPSIDTKGSSEIVASPATGSTTPSATPSLEIGTPEGEQVTSALSKLTVRPRPKNKQRTSAYTHGLLKIPPSEARKVCDHSGWMKKKASGLMTTWKPRLFILRGRRLSYYYSETDTEEKGVIDISGHKVLVANDDPMVTIHASVTGASKASSTPRPESIIASPTKPIPPPGVFYFKLVPPKSGLSRAVQFTKPAVHYFQVDSIEEGRKWMGEIMKATIEHDLSSFETTNKQPTISLAKAKARRERPPDLGDTKKTTDTDATSNGVGDRKSGLGIDLSSVPEVPDKDVMPTSPKALTTLGLLPKPSLARIVEDSEKKLPDAPIEESDNKENAAFA